MLCAALGAAGTAHGAVSFTQWRGTPVAGEDLVVADFDRDGRDDVAASGGLGGGGVEVALGDGSGGFGAVAVHSTGVASRARSVVAADFDGQDGPDIAAVDPGSQNVFILLNDGTGGFDVADSRPLESGAIEAAAGDLDGDGHVDLAVTNYNFDVVRVFPGDGTGDFGAGIDVPAGDGPFGLAVGDVDQDGIDDLVAADNAGNAVSVVLGEPAPPFGGGLAALGPPQNYPVGTGPTAVTLVDADGTGDLDIATSNGGSDDVSLLTADGFGGYLVAEHTPVGTQPQALTTLDLDEDGAQDLAVATFDGVDTLLNDGSGSMVHDGRFPASPLAETERVEPAEFNGDGEADLATTSFGVTTLLGDRLYLEPDAIWFEPRRTGTESAAEPMAVLNSGTEEVEIGALALAGDTGHFGVEANECTGLTLAPGEACVLSFRFTPAAKGEFEAAALLESDAPTGPHEVALLGVAADVPRLFVPPDEIVFPRLFVPDAPRQERITLTNSDVLPVTLGRLFVEGSQAFRVLPFSCTGAPLEAGEECELIVEFAPASAGTHTGTIVIESDAEGAPHRMPVRGEASGSGLSFSARPGLSFRGATPGSSQVRQVRLTNTSSRAAAIGLAITGEDAGAFRLVGPACSFLGANQSCPVAVEFSPMRTGLFTARLEAKAGSASGLEVVVLRGSAWTPKPIIPLSQALTGTLARSGSGWARSNRRALRRRGFWVSFTPQVPGTLRLEVRFGRRLVGRGSKQVAAGQATTVRARPVAFGRRLLRSDRPLKLRATLRFQQLLGPATVVRRTVRLPRPGG